MRFPYSRLTLAAVAALLSACGLDAQDEGRGSATVFHGRVVDGYVAGALVYVDTNDNAKLDAWEDRAFTDRDGYYSYNPVSSTDYCAATTPEDDRIHCLRISADDTALIRMVGGYDMTTGEPFVGTLTMKVAVSAGASATAPVTGSPLTTLLRHMTDAQTAAYVTAEDTAAGLIGLTLTDLQADFLNIGTATTDAQRWSVKLAWQAHKVADVIGSVLANSYNATKPSGAYDGIGKNSDLPRDATSFVYAAIVTEMAKLASMPDLNTFLSNATNESAVIATAEAALVARIAEVNAVTVATVTPTTAVLPSLNQRAANLAAMIQTLFGGNIDASAVAARARAIEVATAVARDPAVTDENIVTAAMNAATDVTNGAAYLTNMASPKTDIAGLTKKFKAGTYAGPADADYSSRTAIDSLTTGGAGLDGQQLALDQGTDSVAMVFATDAGSTDSGTVTLNVASFSGSGNDSIFQTTDANGDGQPDPVAVPGTWEKLNDYSLLLTLEPVPGVTEQVIVKPSLNEQNQTVYYFDYGGEQKQWTPDSGSGFTTAQ